MDTASVPDASQQSVSIEYNRVVNQSKVSRRKVVLLSTILVQVGKSPELAKIMLLLLVWGNVRSRSGFTTLKTGPTLKPSREDCNYRYNVPC